MIEPFRLWLLRFREMEQQRRINSTTSITNQYYYAASTQNQVTIRLTDSTVKALVKSLSSLIDYNGGTKPISLDKIKGYLAQRHNLSDPSDVQTVIEAFQQAYPHVKIATLEDAMQALYRDQTIINTIVRDLVDNELVGCNTYSTDELAKIIKQKYYPPANDAIVNRVFNKLAAQITKVASITKGTYNNPVTYWQNVTIMTLLIHLTVRAFCIDPNSLEVNDIHSPYAFVEYTYVCG